MEIVGAFTEAASPECVSGFANLTPSIQTTQVNVFLCAPAVTGRYQRATLQQLLWCVVLTIANTATWL